jgi:hypothetical protein
MQVVIQQIQFAWKYISQTEFSGHGGFESFAYVLANWLFSFVSFIDIHDWNFSGFALALWLLVCSIGPIVFMRGVRWGLPYSKIYKIGKHGSERSVGRYVLTCLVRFATCAAFVGVLCGLDTAVGGSPNPFTCSVFALLGFALFIASCVIYIRVIANSSS